MIKCEVIKDFTLKRFDELVNIQRKTVKTYGKLYIGDTFECNKEMADYLMGNNPKNETVVKVIEIEPKIVNEKVEETEEIIKPKKTKKKNKKTSE